MTGNEYQKLAARTMRFELGEDALIRHGVFGLTSEAGEVSGLFQKELQGHQMDDEHLMKELGDVCWMVAEICTARGIELEHVLSKNIDKLRERYPEGFDEERSRHRKEGDV